MASTNLQKPIGRKNGTREKQPSSPDTPNRDAKNEAAGRSRAHWRYPRTLPYVTVQAVPDHPRRSGRFLGSQLAPSTAGTGGCIIMNITREITSQGAFSQRTRDCLHALKKGKTRYAVAGHVALAVALRSGAPMSAQVRLQYIHEQEKGERNCFQ